ncbi:MAG: HAD hydrolase-like protein [Candidatus Lindowbacteria bacterium]|nr:HAD hydrolase-like protein [Candidatus Lindowbacteria bacterium]
MFTDRFGNGSPNFEIYPDGYSTAGKTDRAIFSELFEYLASDKAHSPVNDDPVILQEIENAYVERLKVELEIKRSKYQVLPGVIELLDALSSTEMLVGLGTGNLESAAGMKLEFGGLDKYFSFGGYGSDSRVRSKVLSMAVKRASDLSGRDFQANEVVFIGDTDRDISAAQEIGGSVIAVETGPTKGKNLEKADLIVPNLHSDLVYNYLGLRGK